MIVRKRRFNNNNNFNESQGSYIGQETVEIMLRYNSLFINFLWKFSKFYKRGYP